MTQMTKGEKKLDLKIKNADQLVWIFDDRNSEIYLYLIRHFFTIFLWSALISN